MRIHRKFGCWELLENRQTQSYGRRKVLYYIPNLLTPIAAESHVLILRS